MTEETQTEESRQAPATSEPVQVDEKPLDKMTAPELREIAKQIPGVTGVSAMKKSDLLSVIKQHRGISDKDEDKKPGLDTRTVKQKIVQLRKEKGEARGAKDKRKIEILRRRISRLKKKARKAVQG